MKYFVIASVRRRTTGLVDMTWSETTETKMSLSRRHEIWFGAVKRLVRVDEELYKAGAVPGLVLIYIPQRKDKSAMIECMDACLESTVPSVSPGIMER